MNCGRPVWAIIEYEVKINNVVIPIFAKGHNVS